MENLGVMYLAAVAKQAGHKARIVALGDALSYAGKWRPDMVGYSVMTGDEQKMLAVAYYVNQALDVPTVFGGPHPTFFPEDFNGHAIVKGEAEQWMADTLDFQADYSDINSIPWPDRASFPGMKVRDFIASRGCPARCAYCFNDRWNKMFPHLAKVRVRSVKDVIGEIRVVAPEYVYFQDSCFGLSPEWLEVFSKQYRKEINLPFQCHMRPNMINRERVNLLANCVNKKPHRVSVRIALETASSRLRALMNRGKMDQGEVRRAVQLLKEKKMYVMLQNMIGLPEGDIEDDMETLAFNIRCKPTYSWVSIYQPYPGTVMGERCKAEGYYSGDFSEIGDSFFDKSVLNFSDEYKEQLVCLQRIFSLCVETGYMPEIHELTIDQLPGIIHRAMRKLGDDRLYLGVL